MSACALPPFIPRQIRAVVDATTTVAPSSSRIFLGPKNSSSRNCVWGITIRTFLPASFVPAMVGNYSQDLARIQWMINLKSRGEIERMKGASRIVAEILLELRETVREGMSTGDIDRIAEEMTLKKKAKPAFKGYRGFPASICISINEEVVHGIPSPKRALKRGDVVGLDFGVIY